MAMEKEDKKTLTRDDLRWLEERMDRLSKQIRDTNKRIRLLVRILVDKKIIGPELAKSFEETSAKEILEWYENKIKGEVE